MKKITKIISRLLIMAMVTSVSMIGVAKEEKVSGRDIGEHVDIVVNMEASNSSTWFPVIEDNVLVEGHKPLEEGFLIQMNLNWSIPDDVIVNEGDYFDIQLPSEYFSYDFEVSGGEDTHPDNPDSSVYKELYKSGVLLGFWTITNNESMKFVAHSNITDLLSRNGGFGAYGRVSDVDVKEVTFPLEFGDITPGDVTITNPDIKDPDEIAPIFPGAGHTGTKPELHKWGRLTWQSNKIMWSINFGLELYAEIMDYNNIDSVAPRDNIVIYDEVEGTQYFESISASTVLYRPLGEEGGMSMIYGSGDKLTIERSDQADSETKDEWKQRISSSETPLLGLSSDKQMAIVNLGDIGSNGLVYGENNEDIEAKLRASNAYSEEELIVMMKAIGYDTPSYTIGDQTFAIDSWGNGHVISYALDLLTVVEPGKIYTNNVYAEGTSKNHTSTASIKVANADGYVDATNEGKVRLVKADAETEELISGAEFSLEKKEGEDWVPYERKGELVNGTTDSNGEIVFTKLDEGTYRLVEAKAAEGYDLESLKLYKQPIGFDEALTVKDYTNPSNEFTIDYSELVSSLFVFLATNNKEEPSLPTLPELEEEEYEVGEIPSIPTLPELEEGEGEVGEIPSIPTLPELEDEEYEVGEIPSIPTLPELEEGEGEVGEIPSLPTLPELEEGEGEVGDIPSLPILPELEDEEHGVGEIPSIPTLPEVDGDEVQVGDIPDGQQEVRPDTDAEEFLEEESDLGSEDAKNTEQIETLQTGDSSMIYLYIVAMIALLFTLGFILKRENL